ncbi:MAG: hypothetical protein A2W26_00245 [Acidobacteria bacterium RBG_16_64_8]|nr:MAG: hypothetical protein A2W26_00245 [Acidobacteria bacterium RBG_16_64_8]
MTREQLEHAIRAACDVADDTEVYVFGSQAILAEHPRAPAALRKSIEVDVSPRHRVDRVDAIDGAIGELSLFHQTHGFYVHGVPIEEAAKLPDGWRERVVPVGGPETTFGKLGWCLEGHDLAASKLAAFRDKDRDFVRVLLREGLTEADVLLQRIATLPLLAEDKARLTDWVRLTAGALKKRPGRARKKPRTR